MEFPSLCIIEDYDFPLVVINDGLASCETPLSQNTGVHEVKIVTPYGETIQNVQGEELIFYEFPVLLSLSKN